MKTQDGEMNIGVIEGFFGRAWSWEDRHEYVSFLNQYHYSFYIYAPKNDAYLRRKWFEKWPQDIRNEIHELAGHYRSSGIQFGVGLSPFELFFHYKGEGQKKLTNKINELNDVPCDILCILFDDMRGDTSNLAEVQVEIIHRAAEISTAKQIIMCPTYYTYDPILEKVFGKSPIDYIDTIGHLLDANIDIFWTGPEVCSNDYPPDHLIEVAHRLQRKPVLWDNYPVNDGAKKSKFLHLTSFENRPLELQSFTRGHAVNPMNQAWLSKIPLFTLLDSYRQGDTYSPDMSFDMACNTLCEEGLREDMKSDLEFFNKVGLDGFSTDRSNTLIRKYSRYHQNPFATEIIDWLKGRYAFDPACLTE